MLADLIAWAWPALPWLFAAGCCFTLAGVVWRVAIRRHNFDVALDLPAVVHVEHPLGVEPEERTEVVPGIPGATPPRMETGIFDGRSATSALTRIPPYLPALRDPEPDDDEVCDEIILVPALRDVPGPTVAELDALAERLAAATLGPVAGPVCPVCGGPAGACPCHIQAHDDDPLTSTTIRIDSHAPVPLYVAAGGTYDLTEKLKKAVTA